VEKETGVARFTLPDLIDLNRLQRMAESLSAAGGIPVRILGLDGTQYVRAGLQPICQQFHQDCPLSADRCTEFLESLPTRLSQFPFLIETCPNNLWEAAALVSIAGTPLAILLIGPFLLASELPDLSYFDLQAEACNFDPSAYRAALHRLPFFSRQRVENMVNYYLELLRSLAESGLRRMEQQRTAHAVIQSEARWRTLVTNAPAFIATVGRNGVILFLNRTPGDRSPEEMIGSNLYDLLPVEAATKTRSALQAVFEQGQTVEYETQIPRSDGSRMWFKHNVGPILLEGAVSAAMYITTDITETKRTEAHLSYLSTHDALTGLYNRAYFESELTRLQTKGPFPVSIIMADVDGMKQVNDTHGHAAGDDLLRQVASVLLKAFRQQDLIARIGGDEFVIFLPGTPNTVAQSAVQRVQRLILQANQSGMGQRISLSLGIHTASDGDSLLKALQQADAAMYANKPRKRQP
jgi:diguanylate cyclase (GGDEF)-like protein/PAS domain S-box-containing protein